MILNNKGSEEETKTAAKLLFWIGLFSQTQISIGGKLGISELVMAVCSPFVFIKNITSLRNEGVLYYFGLIILWLTGAIFVDIYTHNYLPFVLRGVAVPITVFANSICIYVLLRKNFDNLKWLLLGIAISGVVSIFIFQRGEAGNLASKYGWGVGMERVVGYKLFWVFQLTTWLTLPISGWYQKTPKVYSLFVLTFLSIFNLILGGRSAFLTVAISFMLIVLAGKTRETLEFFKKHVLTIGVLLCLMVVTAKQIYIYAATSGYMGTVEKTKYEKVTTQGTSALTLLMKSRGEFFIGLMAALDKPIIGHGSVAIDNYGYILEFLSKYDSIESYEQINKFRYEYGARIIPAHSHIINYWMWHGIGGLVFWLYIIIMACITLFLRMNVYPPWFGFFAVTIPAFLWDVLFSPFGARVQESTLFVTFLLVSVLERDNKFE